MSYEGDNPQDLESFTLNPSSPLPVHSSGLVAFNETSGFVVSDGSSWLILNRSNLTDLNNIFGEPGSGDALEFQSSDTLFIISPTYPEGTDDFDDVFYGTVPNSGELLRGNGSDWLNTSSPLVDQITTISGFPEINLTSISNGDVLEYKGSGSSYTGSEDLSSNLSGVYKLGDGAASGTDEIGNFNLTNISINGEASGIDGVCPEFYGAGGFSQRIYQAFNSSNFAVPNAGVPYAFSVWFNKDSSIDADDEGTIVALTDTTEGRITFTLKYDESSSNVLFTFYNFFGSPTTITSSTNSALPDSWHHAFCIVRTGTRVGELYLDGSLVGSGAYSTATKTPDTSQNFTIGAIAIGNSSASKRFGGKIDDVHLWSYRNMSGVHATEMYNNGLGLTYNPSISGFVEAFSGSPSIRNSSTNEYLSSSLEELVDTSGSPSSGQILTYNGSNWIAKDQEPEYHTTSLVTSGSFEATDTVVIGPFVESPSDEYSYKVVLTDVEIDDTDEMRIRVVSQNSKTESLTTISTSSYGWNNSTRTSTGSTDSNFADSVDEEWSFGGNKFVGVRGSAYLNLILQTVPNSVNGEYGGSPSGDYNMIITINGELLGWGGAGRRENVMGRHVYDWPGDATSYEKFYGISIQSVIGEEFAGKYYVYRMIG